MKDDLNEQIMKEFVILRAKTCSYLKGNNNEDKKGKRTKKCALKENLEDQKILKTVWKQLKLKTKKNQKKNKISVDSLKQDYKEFIKNNELI